MKTFLALFMILGAGSLHAADISDDSPTSFHLQTTHGTYDWSLVLRPCLSSDTRALLKLEKQKGPPRT